VAEGLLSLRPAVPSDCLLIFEWANDPTSRANSFAPDPIPWATHCAWFERILSDPSRQLYVVSSSDVPIGQVRFEPSGRREAEIALSLAPGWRGRGLAVEVIRLATARADADLVHAYVKPDNDRSRRAFLGAGFVEQGHVVRQGVWAVHFTARPQ
jgi:RimJ/RimL family protein N-acetyltransferase